MADETLPVLEPLPSGPQDVDFNAIIEIAEMNGVSDALDALTNQGVSPEQAGRMLESAGFALPSLAQPEDVPTAETAQQGSPQVRRAEPAIRPTGAIMDVGFIAQLNSAASQEEFNAMYDKLPKVQQHIYDRSFAQDIDPAWASQQAQEFYNEQARINDPKYQEQLRVDRERANALSSQSRNSAQQAAETSDRLLKIMDRLRGGPREGDGAVAAGKEAYRGRVGPFDSSVPNALSFSGGKREGWFADFKTLQDTLGLAEARLNKGQGNMTETERFMLRDAATGGLDYKRDDESFSVIFEDMYSMLQRQAERNKAALASKEGAQQSTVPAAATPAASPAPAAASPAPAASPGFQPGKIYRDAQGRPARFRGYDAQGKPTFDKVQ